MHACIHTAYTPTCLRAYIDACMHACMHTYMHTCIYAYVHTCVRAYMRAFIHSYTRTAGHTYTPACVRTYIHTHTYIHTYVHTYIHIHVHIHVHVHVLWIPRRACNSPKPSKPCSRKTSKQLDPGYQHPTNLCDPFSRNPKNLVQMFVTLFWRNPILKTSQSDPEPLRPELASTPFRQKGPAVSCFRQIPRSHVGEQSWTFTGCGFF